MAVRFWKKTSVCLIHFFRNKIRLHMEGLLRGSIVPAKDLFKQSDMYFSQRCT